jgi:predicted transcriptional regulator
MRKRDKIKIIYDILKVIHDKNNQMLHTHILYKANLSYPILQQYLEELMFKNLVIEQSVDNKRIYSLTDKGFDFLQRYSVVTNFMKVFDLEEPVTVYKESVG